MRVPTSKVQNNFGKYLKFAKDGLDIIVTKNGHDIAKLTGIEEPYIIAETMGAYRAEGQVTYDEFSKMDKDDIRYELIDGYVFALSSPNSEHQEILLELGVQFKNYFRGKKCKPFIAPFDVTLNRDRGEKNVVQPDLLVICDTENITEDKRYEGIPTLVVEVLSLSNRAYDMVLKLDLYKDAYIKEYWLIDPETRTTFVYGLYKKEGDLEGEITKCYSYAEDKIIESIEFSDLKVKASDLFEYD